MSNTGKEGKGIPEELLQHSTDSYSSVFKEECLVDAITMGISGDNLIKFINMINTKAKRLEAIERAFMSKVDSIANQLAQLKEIDRIHRQGDITLAAERYQYVMAELQTLELHVINLGKQVQASASKFKGIGIKAEGNIVVGDISSKDED